MGRRGTGTDGEAWFVGLKSGSDQEMYILQSVRMMRRTETGFRCQGEREIAQSIVSQAA